ncbi:MAG: hypothetical protein ABSH28_05165 [Acidobacteriota bacterium]|jgi:hypothetical protein
MKDEATYELLAADNLLVLSQTIETLAASQGVKDCLKGEIAQLKVNAYEAGFAAGRMGK